MKKEEIFKKGLTTKEAEKRRQQYGPNEIKEREKFTLIKSFINQFNNFLILLLISAAVISWFLNEKLDSIFIFIIVIINALFGLYQEFKAEKAQKALKTLTVTKIRVIRDGKEEEIDNRDLVPGDIVYLEEGTKIPADGMILKSWHLEVNEASLTGESLPIAKSETSDKENKIYLGTVVVKGSAYAQVTKTGEATRFGQIAKTLTLIKEEPTLLQKKLTLFSKQIGIIGILASLNVFGLSFVQNKTLFESFIFAVSLAVAVVPEGLPAVMTIILAIGVEQMAKKKAIVRKLNAIETLGSITLVATDKTGTLTTNQMNIKKIWVDGKIYDVNHPPSLNSHPFHILLLNGILCSTASLVFKVDHGSFDVIGDPTEGALLLLAKKLNLEPDFVKDNWVIVDQQAFDAKKKLMTVLVEKKDKKEKYSFTKGAPESILSLCDKILLGKKEAVLDETKKTAIKNGFQKLARKGFRILGFGYRDIKQEALTFLGFVAIHDPPRPEVIKAVNKARQAGIKTVMITGDNQLTAEAVGIETGIIKEGEDIITGAQIDQFSDEQLLKILPKTKIFARTSPEHKYRLVKLYQQLGEIVAVTGDGVNDALALKQANVGVAMGITGTDVARETADMIITDDNFATIISAINQGRNIFNHIKNTIKFLLSCNTGEVIYILLAVILRLPLLTPLQILYINLVTDGLPAISLAFSPSDTGVMNQPPRKSNSFLGKTDFKHIFSLGLLTSGLSFLAGFPLVISGDYQTGRTIIFTTITLIQPVILIDFWLSHKPLLKYVALLKKPIFLVAFLLPFVLQPLLIYQPLLQTALKTTPLNPVFFFYSLIVPFLILVPIEMRR